MFLFGYKNLLFRKLDPNLTKKSCSEFLTIFFYSDVVLNKLIDILFIHFELRETCSQKGTFDNSFKIQKKTKKLSNLSYIIIQVIDSNDS